MYITDILTDTIRRLADILPNERILKEEPMWKHTSFRIGGPAAAFVLPESEEELSEVLSLCSGTGAEHMLIGNGSNFLVGDEGYPGIMICLGSGGFFDRISLHEDEPERVTVGAAKLLSGTSAFLTEHGLAGLEFASGIPGSIGGAVFMNAGAYGGEMKDVVRSVRLMKPDGSETVELSGEEMRFGYRHSIAEDNGYIILSAELELKTDEPDNIETRVSELRVKRNSKQPVEYPSAGSTFKRPAGGFAAALIDEAGLKGYRSGNAMISEKHAGFVINAGGATAEDVLAVMRHARSAVLEASGILLEPEIRLVNCSL